MADQRKSVAVVVGGALGNGAALTERFGKGGFQVALLARSPAKLDLLREINPRMSTFRNRLNGQGRFALDAALGNSSEP